MGKIRFHFLVLAVFGGVLATTAADLRTNQLMIGDTVVDGVVSNGTISGDRWMVISNTLIRIHAEVTPIDGPLNANFKDDPRPALELMFRMGHGPTKDRSTMHGEVKGLHGLLYMTKGLKTPELM